MRTLLSCGDATKQRHEGGLLALHYTWLLLCLPPAVALGHALLAGLVSATITLHYLLPTSPHTRTYSY